MFYSSVNNVLYSGYMRPPPQVVSLHKHKGFSQSAATSKHRGGRTRLDLNFCGHLNTYYSNLPLRGAASLHKPPAGDGQAGPCGPWAHFPVHPKELLLDGVTAHSEVRGALSSNSTKATAGF